MIWINSMNTVVSLYKSISVQNKQFTIHKQKECYLKGKSKRYFYRISNRKSKLLLKVLINIKSQTLLYEMC